MPRKTPLATVTTISLACPKCGIIKQSGKISCCGRGGSWFGKCGSVGDTNIDHTWHEGLQACKGRTRFGHKVQKAQEQRNGSANGDSSANAKAVITAEKPRAFTSESMPGVLPTSAAGHTLANTSTTHITSNMKSRVHNAAVTTIPPRPSSISTVTPSIIRTETPSITSAHIPLRYNSGQTVMTTEACASINSNGCKQVVDITVHISLLLTVALCIIA